MRSPQPKLKVCISDLLRWDEPLYSDRWCVRPITLPVKAWTTRRKSGPRDLNPWQLCNRGLIESLWLASHSSHWKLGNDLNDLDGSWKLMGVARAGKPTGRKPAEAKKGCQFFFLVPAQLVVIATGGIRPIRLGINLSKRNLIETSPGPKNFEQILYLFVQALLTFNARQIFKIPFVQNCS